MERMHGWVVLAAGMLALAAGPSQAAKAGADSQLQEQLDTLREDQQALRKEFDELKKLLQDRGVIPPPRVQKIDGVIELGVAPVKGSGAAPLTMIEFSDYQCPFCARHAQQTLPEIDRDYIATGKVRYVFRDLPLPIHPEAPKAAEAAHCAGDQGKYWEMHDWLFANQGALGAEKLVEYGTALGLDAASYKACLDSGKHACRARGRRRRRKRPVRCAQHPHADRRPQRRGQGRRPARHARRVSLRRVQGADRDDARARGRGATAEVAPSPGGRELFRLLAALAGAAPRERGRH